MMPRAVRLGLLACSAVVLLSGPAAAQDDENDPLEPVNRAIFEFNRVLDGLFLEPAARFYRLVFPDILQEGVSNALNNARSPVILLNDVLQGKPERAEITVGRFMFNTMAGLGGIVDVASMIGLPEHHDEDFGQTLAVYGVGPGPYLMLPVFGPSNPRDTVGMAVGVFTDPISLFAPTEASISRSAAEGISFREANIETIEELERTSLDFYAATRTLIRQRRADEIRDGAAAPLEDIYDESIFEEDFEDPAAPEGTDVQ